jgi:DNA invertase Pin-like site-specific DNA recombinase
MKIGYARVSTLDQDLGRQILALEQAGCKSIFTDKISGTKSSRPGLSDMVEKLQPGDVVVVQKLDRLGRSLKHLIQQVNEFHDRGVEFVSLGDNFDTTTPNGKLLFSIIGAIAEFERDIISERVKNGLAFVRRTKKLGRPVVEKDWRKVGAKEKVLAMRGQKISVIAKETGLSRPTVYKILAN